MRSKKGQMQHVFMYILTIVIVGLVLLMGYRVIGNTIKQGCEVEHIKFTSDILGLTTRYDSYGSYHKESIHAPCDFEKICFVDSDLVKAGAVIDSGNSIIDNYVGDAVKRNIFLVSKTTEPIGFVDKVKVENPPGYICIEAVGGQFKIAFRGTGRSTQIESY